MKKTFSAFAKESNQNETDQQESRVNPAVQYLAKWLRRIGRWAMILSFIVGLFAAKVAHAKLGFMILLPAGMLLIALASYLVKQVNFLKFKLKGREAELFAYVLGGCSVIALLQVLIERFVLHSA